MQLALRSLLVLLSLLLSSAVFAATVLKLDLDQLKEKADAIAVSEVVAVDHFMVEGRVFTRTHFQVLETWKGGPLRTFVIQQPGGRIGNLVTRVPGLPTFEKGEKTILFLEKTPRTPEGYFVVLGLEQGKFQLDGTNIVPKPDVHLHLVNPNGTPATPVTNLPRTLDNFRETVANPSQVK